MPDPGHPECKSTSGGTELLANYGKIPDPKLAALSAFTHTLWETRGLPERSAVQTFLGAGYSERHILEIVLALAVKTLSNYTNHLCHTPLDQMFAAYAWEKSHGTP